MTNSSSEFSTEGQGIHEVPKHDEGSNTSFGDFIKMSQYNLFKSPENFPVWLQANKRSWIFVNFPGNVTFISGFKDSAATQFFKIIQQNK